MLVMSHWHCPPHQRDSIGLRETGFLVVVLLVAILIRDAAVMVVVVVVVVVGLGIVVMVGQ
eukprot:CAMPEP_0195015852 /NCGR_PEP_ID=MMETSP0326_2-20130528/21771_1 /TAXON_ID=2866 ORGANISM="Crypthecodinium cohnii, Strain Seligo" /NCGR_SAMPLE_ID=MMETSP0326_2 /ASSEMBLY_ACC=CAM_ASM_000348 /LENGTH=60 /DNA_ID=CAMNT_0040030773 /DNA_START=1 /DNA_END=183 /DNA_ORIENTATION=+